MKAIDERIKELEQELTKEHTDGGGGGSMRSIILGTKITFYKDELKPEIERLQKERDVALKDRKEMLAFLRDVDNAPEEYYDGKGTGDFIVDGNLIERIHSYLAKLENPCHDCIDIPCEECNEMKRKVAKMEGK